MCGVSSVNLSKLITTNLDDDFEHTSLANECSLLNHVMIIGLMGPHTKVPV